MNYNRHYAGGCKNPNCHNVYCNDGCGPDYGDLYYYEGRY